MLQITKQGNSIVVKGLDHALYPYSGTLEIPCNSVITVVDDGDIVTFRSASNYDVLFSGLVSEITINGEAVTKENVGDKFGAISNTTSGGGGGEGGLTPEQEQRLNNAVQISNYNADKEAQATIDESQNASIEVLRGNIDGKQDKIEDLDAIRNGAEKGATALQDETDPVWTAEKVNYYNKVEVDTLVGEAKSSANSAISIASSAEGIATEAHSRANEAMVELDKKANKSEIPSLDGYATQSWVEGKGYLTEHQDISGKLDKTEAASTYQPKGNYATKDEIPSLEGYATEQWVGGQGYLTEHQKLKTINGETIVGDGNIEIKGGGITEETDPTVPQYVKSITEADIDKWNKGGNTGEVVGNNEAPKDNIGIGVFDGTGEEIHDGEPINTGDLFYMRPLNVGEIARVGKAGANIYLDYIDNDSPYYQVGQYTNWTVYNTEMEVIPANEVTKGSALYARWNGTSGTLFNINIFTKASDKKGVYIYDGTETPSKVATEKTHEAYATEQWVEGKGYLTEHQDISGKLDKTEAASTYQPKGNYLTVETDPVWTAEKGNYYDKVEIDGMFTQADATYQPKGDYATKGEVATEVGNKQDTLISGTTIKTINGESILGSGNIEVQVGGAVDSVNGKTGAVVLTAEELGAATTRDLEGYYTKVETDDLVGNVRTTAEGASSVASTAQSKADEALAKLDSKADKSEIPSLVGYATEQWVEGKGYLTEHQDISGKQDVITDLADIRNGAALGKTALQSFTETDPTVPAHVKAITEADIAKWNQGGGGEPVEYIKNAEKSVDGNTLTLTKKDGSEVVFSQNLDGYATEQWVGQQGYLTEHQPLKTINGETIVGDGNIDIRGGCDYYRVTHYNNYINLDIYVFGIFRVDDKEENPIKPQTTNINFYKADGTSRLTSGDNMYTNNLLQVKPKVGEVSMYVSIQMTDGRYVNFWFTFYKNIQHKLVSNVDIKTINGESILGSGDLVISGGSEETDPIWTAEKVNYYTKAEVDEMIGNINNALATLING